MMRPRPAARIAGITACDTRNTPPTLMSRQALNRAGSRSATWPSTLIPALFTSTSTVPNRSSVAAIAARTDSGSPTSQANRGAVVRYAVGERDVEHDHLRAPRRPSGPRCRGRCRARLR